MPARTLALCSMALGAGIMAGPAGAAVMRASYSGVLSSGMDEGNYFGLGASADLTGQAFEALLTYDTDRPGADRQTSSGEDTISGSSEPATGTFFNPVLSSSITVNGVKFAIPQPIASADTSFGYGSASSSVSAADPGSSALGHVSSFYDIITDASTEDSTSFEMTPGVLGNASRFPFGLEQVFETVRTPEAGFESLGGFALSEYVRDQVTEEYTTFRAANGVFDTHAVSVSTVTAVPVPATIPLLLTAFGALGLVARRRGRAG